MKILLTAINAKYIHSNLAVYCLKAYVEKYFQKHGVNEKNINPPPAKFLFAGGGLFGRIFYALEKEIMR